MVKTIKNKFILIITLSFCLMLGITGYFALKPKESIKASSQNISVRYGNFDKDSKTFNEDKTVNDDTFVLLPTDHSKAIKVHFGLSNSEDSIISLSASLTINGISMDTEQNMEVNNDTTEFTQYIYYGLSLKENPTDTSSNISYTGLELQGEYIYTFQYVSTLTDSKQVETVKFYVGFESDYLNNNINNNFTEPKLYNTEKIFRYKDEGNNNIRGDKNSSASNFLDATNKEFNYFHFSNKDIFEYSASSSSDKKDIGGDDLLFPTYTYDASRYNLSWTCALNGITTYYTTEFISNNERGSLNIYKSSSSDNKGQITDEYGTIISNAIKINTNTNLNLNDVNNYKANHYFVNIQFDQVGEYQFTLQPVISVKENSYKIVDTLNTIYTSDYNTDYNAIADYYYLFGDVELRVFGYELFYTNYNGGNEDVLQFITRDKDNNLITADVTNKATDADQFTTKKNFDDVLSIFNSNIVTNQAPIMFSKYAAQMSMANTIKSKSTCLYYSTENTPLDSVILANITNSTKFSSNGYYIVTVKYTYMYYCTYSDGVKSPETSKEFYQVFAFQIKNTEPTVTITSNSETLYSNEITNDKILFKYETNNSLFDVLPKLNIYAKNSGNNDFVNVTNNTKYVELLDTSATLKEFDNDFVYYKAELQYGPNKNTSVLYSFTIDTTNINSSVYNVNKNTNNKYIVGTKVSEQNTFAVVNQDFYLNINQNNPIKNSNAVISATYDFYSLQKGNTLNSYNSNNTQNFTYIENGYYIDLATKSTYNYGVATFKDNNEFDVNNASYVLTNPGLYVFTIKDSAGNSATKTVLYENTAPIILIDNNLNDNTDNTSNNEEYSVLSLTRPIYLQSVRVAYGQYKTIKINNFNNNIIPDSVYLHNLNTETIHSTYFCFSNSIETFSLSSKGNFSVLRINNQIPYGYELKLEKPNDGCTYTLSITSNGIKSDTKNIEMSTDNSQFIAHPLEEINGNLTNESRIDEFNYTNKNFLKFSWVNDLGGDYEIDSILLNYFPLTYDLNSKYYPYAETPTATTDLLNTATITKKYLSDLVDSTTDCYASIEFNATGMYLVERTYKNDISSDNSNNPNTIKSLDQKVRRYIYFIDRNDIFKVIELSSNNSIVLGSLLNLVVGKNIDNLSNYQITLDYNDFISKENNNLFNSNKLPVEFIINGDNFNSYYKYSQIGIVNAKNTTDIFQNVYVNNKFENWLETIKSAYKLTFSIDGKEINSSDSKITLFENGSHKILIKDSNMNWNLNFTIESQAPTGYFIKQTSNNNYALLDEKPINYTENLKFAWNEPTSEFSAKIDKSKIKIFINGNLVDFDVTNISSNDSYDNIINIDDLLYDFNEGDLLVEIHLEYYGNDSYANYTSIKKIYIDRTAPDINYSFMKQNDTYLSNSEKLGFDDYHNNLSFDNYSFNIDKDFILRLENNDNEFSTNTNSLYIRHYDKFNEDLSSSNYVNYQSLVNTDDRYLDNDQLRLKFDIAHSGKIQTSNDTYMYLRATGTERAVNLYNYLYQSECPYKYGYFEIIEVDQAGNQRIFTVYLPNYVEDEESNLTEEEIVFVDEDGNIISEDINSGELPQFSIELDNNNLNQRFLVLEIFINGTFDSIYKISPISLDGYISFSEVINIIKEKSKLVDDLNGTRYEFSIYYDTISSNNVTRNKSSLNYNYPSEKISLILNPVISGNTKNLIVTWNNNASTYIKKLVVQTANTDGSYSTISSDKDGNSLDLLVDKDGNYISKTFIFNIQAGEYFKFTLTDNFNREYSIDYIAGLDTTKEIIYAKNSIEINGITYTAGQTNIIYQAKLYKVELYNLLSDTPDTILTETQLAELGIKHNTNSTTGLASYSLFNLNQPFLLQVKIINLDGTFVYETKTIQYINKLATVELKFGSDVVFDLDTSISSDINSTLNALSLYIKNETLPEELKTRVFATITIDGTTTDLGQIESGTTFSEYGKYTLTISNSLGLSKTFVFEFRNSKAIDFTVSTITGKILTSSPKKYSYANTTCEWFFSTQDYIIEYSGRFASCEQDFVGDDGNTIVYKLTTLNDTGDPTKTKVKYFTVTKINTTSNILADSNFTINSNKITSTSNNLKYFDNEIVLKIEKPYNQYEGNIITVSYSFNDSKLITINFDNITQYNLSDAGIYTFYFSDVAGNTQVFNNTKYLTVSLFNKVITLVNNGGQINNAIYNSNVEVSIVNYNEYVYENKNTIQFNVTKDGNRYPITGRYGVYNFTEYGIYNISITGIMQGRTLENELKFTILNPNEALVVYEYIGNSGYEITRIIKDGKDVYNDILVQMSKQVYEDDVLLTSLSKIVLSGSTLENHIGGNGKYQVTVTARKVYNNLDLDFTFNVWINSENDVYILSSISAGTSTTKEIEIRINPKQIFEKIGTCNITINDQIWLNISADGNVYSYLGPTNGIELVQSSSSDVAYNIYKLTKTGNYNFKIQTISGNNTLMSFTVTKTEPLNGTAILVIVIVVIVIGAIITLFVLLRKKMRVK